MKVFVYGTLKRGQGNHHVMTDSKGLLIDTTETVKDYVMLNFTAYPGVVEAAKFSEAEPTTIKGEVYEVPSLDYLDALEGYPHLYYREEVKLKDGTTAWMYLYNLLGDGGNLSKVSGGEW